MNGKDERREVAVFLTIDFMDYLEMVRGRYFFAHTATRRMREVSKAGRPCTLVRRTRRERHLLPPPFHEDPFVCISGLIKPPTY